MKSNENEVVINFKATEEEVEFILGEIKKEFPGDLEVYRDADTKAVNKIILKSSDEKQKFTITDAMNLHDDGFDVYHDADSKEIMITKSLD